MAKKKATKKPLSKKKIVAKKVAPTSKKSTASKKKTTSKKTSKIGNKKAKSGGGPATLSDQLKADVVNTLKYWQINFGRSGIRQLMMELMSPFTAHTQFLQWMLARGQTYYSIIKAAKDNGETYPFVVPMVGAVAFESMFQACAGFWLVAGEPPKVDELRPDVLKFINVQVSLFVTTVGAD